MLARSVAFRVKDDGYIVTNVNAKIRQGQALILPIRLVLEEENAAFPANGKIEISIAVQVRDGNLHAAASSTAVIDDVSRPLELAINHHAPIPIHAKRFALARIFA